MFTYNVHTVNIISSVYLLANKIHKAFDNKITFDNVDIHWTNAPSIFRDNAVESSIPIKFENKGQSVVCYKDYQPLPNVMNIFL